MTIDDLVRQVAAHPDCRVLPPAGPPRVPDRLPDDLARFYELCGGAELFPGAAYASVVVRPGGFLPANRVVLGEEFPGDWSDAWFVVAREADGPLVVIDLDQARHGRCYDAFGEVYGVAGSMAVVAASFTELLASLLANEGRHWWWLEPGWNSLGDAYD